MKFTQLTLSLALTSMVSAAAIPTLPGADGVVGGLEGAADGVVAGVAGGHLKRQTRILDPVDEEVTSGTFIDETTQNTLGGFKRELPGVDSVEHAVSDTLGNAVKRQLEVVQPVTEGVASSLNGGTGIVGSAVGTAESTGQGAVGTVESTVAGAAHVKRDLPGVDTVKQTLSDTLGNAVKRQLEVVQPVTESVSSSLNGATGIIGSAAGTAESTGQGAVGTVESTVAGVGSGMLPTEMISFEIHPANHDTATKRQLGNLPATASQTGTDIMAGLSGSMFCSDPS